MKRNVLISCLLAGCIALSLVGCSKVSNSGMSEIAEESSVSAAVTTTAAPEESTDSPAATDSPTSTSSTQIAESSNGESTESAAAPESSAAESSTSALDTPYPVTYDAEKIPDGLALAIARYFYSIMTQDFELYSAQINPVYFDAMTAALEEDYGYGMEHELESSHETLLDYAGTEDFAITDITMTAAADTLAEQYSEGEDFIGEYLDNYANFLGDDFVTELQNSAAEIYDVCLYMTATGGDGSEIVILNNMEILAVQSTDGTFGVLG